MNNLCSETGYVSLNKFGEQLCGDCVECILQDDMTIIVLADGLGSGVKANILSTLTSKIISTMMANGLSVEECVSAIAATLPICKTREIAYSTFTILRLVNNEEIEIIQYDNPHVILLRNGKNYEYPQTEEEIDGKTIFKSKIKIEKEDLFIAVSDGSVHAGVGRQLNFGWLRKDIIQFLEIIYKDEYSAKTISSILLEQCRVLYGDKPGDDTTICSLKIKERKPMNLMIGPPANPQDVNQMMSLFFAEEGQHIVCGGTTSALAAEYLQKPLLVGDLTGLESDIPPMAEIEGIDLVTEGVITANRVLEYAKDYLEENKLYVQWGRDKDGASCIARMLFEEATDIHFFVGKAVNPAHQNPNLPIGFNIKMKLIDELAECLKQMGKKIKVSYF